MSKRRRITCLEPDSEDEVSPPPKRSKPPQPSVGVDEACDSSFIDDADISLPPPPESDEEDRHFYFLKSGESASSSDSESDSESDYSDEETGSESEVDCDDLLHPYVYDN